MIVAGGRVFCNFYAYEAGNKMDYEEEAVVTFDDDSAMGIGHVLNVSGIGNLRLAVFSAIGDSEESLEEAIIAFEEEYGFNAQQRTQPEYIKPIAMGNYLFLMYGAESNPSVQASPN